MKVKDKEVSTIAMDLGGTKLASAVVTYHLSEKSFYISNFERLPVRLENGCESAVHAINKKYRELKLKFPQAHGLGLASAGPQNLITGELLNPTNLGKKSSIPERWPLLAELKKSILEPIYFDNDAAAAAWAEYQAGALRGCQNGLAVTLGTGVGVGVILNGKLFRAGPEYHPEAGHVLLNMDDQEILTGAEDSGTAESFLGGPHFIERLKKKGQLFDSMESLLAKAGAKAPGCSEALEQYGKWLAAALFNYCVLFYPEKIVLSGGVSHAFDFFSEIMRVELRRRLGNRVGSSIRFPEIKLASYQEEAGCLGAGIGLLNQI